MPNNKDLLIKKTFNTWKFAEKKVSGKKKRKEQAGWKHMWSPHLCRNLHDPYDSCAAWKQYAGDYSWFFALPYIETTAGDLYLQILKNSIPVPGRHCYCDIHSTYHHKSQLMFLSHRWYAFLFPHFVWLLWRPGWPLKTTWNRCMIVLEKEKYYKNMRRVSMTSTYQRKHIMPARWAERKEYPEKRRGANRTKTWDYTALTHIIWWQVRINRQAVRLHCGLSCMETTYTEQDRLATVSLTITCWKLEQAQSPNRVTSWYSEEIWGCVSSYNMPVSDGRGNVFENIWTLKDGKMKNSHTSSFLLNVEILWM